MSRLPIWSWSCAYVTSRQDADSSGTGFLSVSANHAALLLAQRAGRLLAGALGVGDGRVGALMKGSLHTDELLSAVMARENGLRTDRWLSHVFLFDVPAYDKLLMVTDGAINIAPTLEQKRDIAQNAIDLARLLGIDGTAEAGAEALQRRGLVDLTYIGPGEGSDVKLTEQGMRHADER